MKTKPRERPNISSIDTVISIKNRPLYCKGEYSCTKCTTQPNYTFEEVEKIGQHQVNNELSIHGHKKSLIIGKNKKRMRNTLEAKEELKEHYKYVHNM